MARLQSAAPSHDNIRRILSAIDEIVGLRGDEDVDDGFGLAYRSAQIVADRLGGEVIGWWDQESPSLLSAELGGYDLAFVGNRWIVDWWANGVAGLGRDLVDLWDETQENREYVERHYGKIGVQLMVRARFERETVMRRAAQE